MASFGKALGYNMFGQFFGRIISFAISMYLLRVVDNDILGLVNVRLTLLYNTINFLTREPFRKASILGSDTKKFVNTLWLSPILCFLISIACFSLWSLFSSSDGYLPYSIVIMFPLSSFIESLSEPFIVISLRFSLASHFAIAQYLLVVLQRVVVFGLIISLKSTYHLQLFAFAQVVASTIYTLFNFTAFYRYSRMEKEELREFRGYRAFYPTAGHGIDKIAVSSLGALLSHSLLKQLLTDGSAYVMTFTELLSLKQQAVYDAIERLASIVARIILAPLEENCYAEFSNSIAKINKSTPKDMNLFDQLVNRFQTILHIVCILGLVICTFGTSYSPLAVSIYGGKLLSENGGALLLALYSFYILIMTVNGITECFAMASMNNAQIFSHGGFLFISSISHVILSMILCMKFGGAGFILANWISMLVRIVYSWRHISTFLGKKMIPIFDLLPSGNVAVALLFSLFATGFSYFIFGSAPGLVHAMAHIAVGGVMLILVAFHIYHSDFTIRTVIESFYHKHAD